MNEIEKMYSGEWLPSSSLKTKKKKENIGQRNMVDVRRTIFVERDDKHAKMAQT